MAEKDIKEAVFKTLAYSSIFSYPLTKEEIWHWLIWENGPLPSKTEFSTAFSKLSLNQKAGYYYLDNHEGDMAKRINKAPISIFKKAQAQEIARWLSHLPTILCIGISGGLAMENVTKDDDIDLFIITKKDLVWTTRLLATLLLDLRGLRRKPDDQNVADKLCLNMFLDENHLSIPENDRNIYSAHEVVQMIPLFNRNNCYELFLKQNFWIKKFLPNALPNRQEIDRGNNKKKFPPGNLLLPLERLVMLLQIWYMKKRRTNETINQGVIKFHPHDRSLDILSAYKKLCRKIGVRG